VGKTSNGLYLSDPDEWLGWPQAEALNDMGKCWFAIDHQDLRHDLERSGRTVRQPGIHGRLLAV
jgi:hypothetical protein